jgi:hypothetical protein
MHLKNVLSTISAISLVFICGAAAAAQSPCTSCPDTMSAPNNQKGTQTLVTAGPAADQANVLGSIVGGFVTGGGGDAQNASLGLKRYSLSGSTGAAAAPGGNQWNVWGAYSHSEIAYTFSPLRSDGNVNVYIAGVDYTYNSKFVFGVATAFDRTEVNQNFSGGKISGDGVTVSPYFGWLINKNLAFDATVGYGRSNVDTSVSPAAVFGGGLVVGSTHSDRNMQTLGLTYRESFGAWTLTGRGGLLHVHDKLGAYTLSNGTLVPDGTVNLTQARLTGTVAYSGGMFTPYFSLSYINDLSRPDQAPVGGVAAANDRDAWTPAVGVRFRLDNSVYGSIQYSTERNRQEVKNDQLLINVGIRF